MLCSLFIVLCSESFYFWDFHGLVKQFSFCGLAAYAFELNAIKGFTGAGKSPETSVPNSEFKINHHFEVFIENNFKIFQLYLSDLPIHKQQNLNCL